MKYHATLILCAILIFCASCTLLKKSTKSTLQNKVETNGQTYLDRLDLKTANKETRTYTYWKDSLLYQYQHVLENTEEAKQYSYNTVNKQLIQQQQQQKKTEPPDVWTYGIMTVALIGILILYLFKFRQFVFKNKIT